MFWLVVALYFLLGFDRNGIRRGGPVSVLQRLAAAFFNFSSSSSSSSSRKR